MGTVEIHIKRVGLRAGQDEMQAEGTATRWGYDLQWRAWKPGDCSRWEIEALPCCRRKPYSHHSHMMVTADDWPGFAKKVGGEIDRHLAGGAL